MSAGSPSYRRLVLGARPKAENVDQFLRRLAQPGAPRPLVFETWANNGELAWLWGLDEARLPELRSLANHLLGGGRLIALGSNERPRVQRVLSVRLRTPSLPLDPDRLDAVIHALYESLGRVRGDEVLGLQVVTGRGFAPRLLPPAAAGRQTSVLQRIGVIGDPADGDRGRTRARLESQAAEASLLLTIRVGAAAGHAARERALLAGVRDALRLLDAPGARLQVSPDSPDRMFWARPNLIRVVRLSTLEAIPFLGLPASDADLPGLPLHPARPLAPRAIEVKELVFARTSAPGDDRRVGISPAALLQHLVITGPTGSGKSTVLAAIAEQWVRSHHPIALLDPKRQLIDHLLARLPKSAAGRVVVLDPTDEPVVGFNPLDTSGRNADVVVDGILSSLRVIFDDGWGPRTEDLLLAGLKSLALAGEQRGEPFTLIDLPRLFTDAALRRRVVGSVQRDPVLASFWGAFDAQSDGARAAQIAAPLNKLRRFLLRPNLVAVLGQSRPRVRVRDLFRGDQALLVPLNDSLVGPGSAQLLGSLLVAELFQAAQERALEVDPRSRPALVAIDEAQRFIHLPTALEDALSTSRSYGVAWIAAHQHRAQLSAGLRAGFDSNALSKLVYRSSYDDARDYARLARSLSAEDFMSLDAHEAYLTLVHEGSSTPWFAVRALPPRPELGYADVIRAASRDRFGSAPVSGDVTPDPTVEGPTHRKPRSA